MSLKKHSVVLSNFDLDFQIMVSVDPDFVLPEEIQKASGYITCMDSLRDTVDFHVGNKELLQECGGDYVKAFLQKLGKQMFFQEAQYGVTTEKHIELMKEVEGWMPLDGTYGVTLLSVDEVELATAPFEIEELP